MRLYKNCCLLGTAACLSLTSCNNNSNRNPQPQNIQIIQEQSEPDVWLGPGFYYGLWFGSEVEFNNYQNFHGHGHGGHHHDHGGDHHGNHGHGGGGHQHGGGSGGHGHSGGGHQGGGHGGGGSRK